MDKKLKNALDTFEGYIKYNTGKSDSDLTHKEREEQQVKFHLDRMNGDDIAISLRKVSRAWLYENGNILNRPPITVDEVCSHKFLQSFANPEKIVAIDKYTSILFLFNDDYARSRWTNRILTMVKGKIKTIRLPEYVVLNNDVTLYFTSGHYAGDKFIGLTPAVTIYKRLV